MLSGNCECVCVWVVSRRRRQRRHTFQKIISSRSNMLTHSSFEREIQFFLCKNGIAGNIVGLIETERMDVVLWCCCYGTYSEMRAQFSFRFISWLNTVEIIRLPYVLYIYSFHVIALPSNEFRYFFHWMRSLRMLSIFIFSEDER